MYKNDYMKRRAAFLKEMKDESFALFSSGQAPFKAKDQLYPFFVNRNFFYLAGLQKEKFILLLFKSGKQVFEYLFIEEPSDYATKWLGSRMTQAEANAISGIEEKNILFLQNFDSFVANNILLDSRVSIAKKPRHLYLDLFRQHLMVKPYGYTAFDKIVETYPELKIKDATTILDELRRLKSDTEIAELKKAIAYTNEGIKALMSNVKPNMNERELEALFENTIKNSGSEGTSFNTISASGKNATVLHYEENNSVIEDNTLVLNDLGALSNEYAADITRTYPANGRFTERQKQYYELVLSVNKTIISMVKPGVTFKELNEKAFDMLANGMIKLGKIKDSSELKQYYYHSIGHYLGLDVHDVGINTKPLEPGVILTVEPGIYVGEEQIGIRIEDNILVTKDGYSNLSEAIIKEVKDIEEFMKK